MKEKDSSPNVWRYLIGTRQFWFGFLAMILAVILSFASIYPSLETRETVMEFHGSSDIKYARIAVPYNAITNELHLTYVGEGNIRIVIREDLDLDKPPMERFTMNSPTDERYLDLPTDANWLFIEDFTGPGVVVMEHNVEYTGYPYSLLFIPAVILLIYGLFLINKGYKGALDLMVHDMWDEDETYEPPWDE